MIRVLLADDHVLFRQGLRRLLELENMVVVGEASTGPETLERTRETDPEVVLLDVSMPGRGAVEIIQELKQRRKRTGVLILTGHPEDHFAIRCLKSGADGYLTKDHPSELLISAIRRVAAGSNTSARSWPSSWPCRSPTTATSRRTPASRTASSR